jgi:hypothetical protein
MPHGKEMTTALAISLQRRLGNNICQAPAIFNRRLQVQTVEYLATDDQRKEHLLLYSLPAGVAVSDSPETAGFLRFKCFEDLYTITATYAAII